MQYLNKKKNFILVLCLLLFIVSFSGGCGGSSHNYRLNNTSQNQNTEKIWETLREAYIFSFPLIIMDSTKIVGTNTVKPTDSKAPVNQFLHAKTLATAKFRQVVTPNVDTVYSQIFIDLSNDALVIHKPASTRFLSLEIMDAWSDCVTVLGTGGDTDSERTYLLTPPNFKGSVPENMVRVEMPTSMGWLLGRTVCFGEDDLQNVYDIQANLTSKTLTEYLNNSEMPDGVYDKNNEFVPRDHALSLSAKDFFDKVNELLINNSPYKEDYEIIQKISTIGVGAGLDFDDSILDDEDGSKWEQMKNQVRSELTKSVEKYMITNGAFQNYGEPIARFGTAYDYRFIIAVAAFGANPVDIAIYPRATHDSDGCILNAENSYVLHFEKDALPPTREKGFWSITAYGEDNFLIDNELDRYCINDRSINDVTFNSDGSLDILLQSSRPSENVNNWLPIGNEGFHLYMRIYLPQDSALNGTWKAPTITKIR